MPIVSFALSLPTLLVALVLTALAIVHAATGSNLDANLGAPAAVQLPVGFALMWLYFLLGPMLGAVICLTQRTRTEETYGSVHLLGFRMKRLNTLALWSAGLALGALVLLVMTILAIAFITRNG